VVSIKAKFLKAIRTHYLILVLAGLGLVFVLMRFFPLGHPFLAFYAIVFGMFAVGGRKLGTLVAPLAADDDYQEQAGTIDDARRLRKRHKLWIDIPWATFGVAGMVLEALHALLSALQPT
jgi:hypothetical protein